MILKRKREGWSVGVTLSQRSGESSGAPSKNSKGRLCGSSGASATTTQSPTCSAPAAEIATAYAQNRKQEAGSGGVTLSQCSDEAAGSPSKMSKGRLGRSSGASATTTPSTTCSTPAPEIATTYAHNRKQEAVPGGVTLSLCSDEAAGAPSKMSKGRLFSSLGESATAIPIPPCYTPATEISTTYAQKGLLPIGVILKSKRKAGSGGVTISQLSDEAADAPRKKGKGSLGGSSGASAIATLSPACSTPATEIATTYTLNRKEECRSPGDVVRPHGSRGS